LGSSRAGSCGTSEEIVSSKAGSLRTGGRAGTLARCAALADGRDTSSGTDLIAMTDGVATSSQQAIEEVVTYSVGTTVVSTTAEDEKTVG
jgi:hypothetical protein